MDASSDGLLRNRECRAFLLPSDDRVTLVASPDEIAVLDPLLLQEFDRGHRLGADEHEHCAARNVVIFFGQRVRIVWWSIRRAAPYQAMQIDIGQTRQFGIARIHAPDVRSERNLPATRVVCIIEVVVPLRIRAEAGVVNVRRQRQWCAAAPTADQLRGQQFPFFLSLSVRLEESIECADPRLIFAKTYKGAIAAENVRLRHRQGNAGFTRISKNELAGFDRLSLAR